MHHFSPLRPLGEWSTYGWFSTTSNPAEWPHWKWSGFHFERIARDAVIARHRELDEAIGGNPSLEDDINPRSESLNKGWVLRFYLCLTINVGLLLAPFTGAF